MHRMQSGGGGGAVAGRSSTHVKGAYGAVAEVENCVHVFETETGAHCGSLLAAMMRPPEGPSGGRSDGHCRQCGEGKAEVDVVTIPYVFQYLTNELAAMNIKTQITLNSMG